MGVPASALMGKVEEEGAQLCLELFKERSSSSSLCPEPAEREASSVSQSVSPVSLSPLLPPPPQPSRLLTDGATAASLLLDAALAGSTALSSSPCVSSHSWGERP